MEGERSKENTNGVTLKALRKHIKRLVNYAEAGDGGKIWEELKRIVPENWRMMGNVLPFFICVYPRQINQYEGNRVWEMKWNSKSK